MKKISAFSIIFSLLLLFLFVGNSTLAESSKPQECIGNFTWASFDDLVVPPDQTCQLDQFNVVDGDIKVEKGANLVICPDNQIRGSVKAHKANSVYISDQTGGPCSPAKALGITIDGDVKVEGANSVSLIGNPYGGIAVVKGDVNIEKARAVLIQSFNNLSKILGDVKINSGGDVAVLDNVISGDLKINASITCTEANNTISGKINSCP